MSDVLIKHEEKIEEPIEMKCTRCSLDLDSEERDDPRKDADGGIVCDECFDELYRRLCPICEESFYEDLSKKISPSHFILTEYGADKREEAAGLYEILEYPFFFADGITEWYFFSSAINRIADLSEDIDEEIFFGDVYCVCEDCVERLRKSGGRNSTMIEFEYKNKRTGVEYMNIGRALDEAEDQNDIEVIGDRT